MRYVEFVKTLTLNVSKHYGFFFSGFYHDIMTPCQVSEILVIVFIFLIFFKRRSNTNLKYFSYTVQFETTYQNKFSFPMSYKTKEECMFQNLSENNEKLHLCSIKWRDLVPCLRNLHEICWVCEDFDTKCFKTLWIFFLRALSWYNDTIPSFRNFGDSFHILKFF